MLSLRQVIKMIETKAISAVIGGTLILISLAIDYSYANLSTYAVSYLRSKEYSVTYADWIYITITQFLMQSTLMPFTGILERKIGTRLCIILGSLVYSLSLASTYFLIDYGLPALIYSLCIAHGIGFSLMYTQTIGCILKWFLNGNQGLMSSIAIGGYGFGSIIWIPLQTQFVNPHNLEAEPEDPNDPDSDKYFTDPTILEKIPKLFVLMAGMILSLEILGFILMNPPKIKEISEKNVDKENVKDRSIKETLKMKEFWCLWTYLMAIRMSATFFLTYGKSFGLKYINDDSFFSYIGIVNNVLNGSSRIIWGKLYDWKGFKVNSYFVAILPALASMAVNLLVYIPAENEVGNKLLFGTLSAIFFAVNPGVYPIIAPTIQATFGHLNFARDYGMIFTQSVRTFLVPEGIISNLAFSVAWWDFTDICATFPTRSNRIFWVIFAVWTFWTDCDHCILVVS